MPKRTSNWDLVAEAMKAEYKHLLESGYFKPENIERREREAREAATTCWVYHPHYDDQTHSETAVVCRVEPSGGRPLCSHAAGSIPMKTSDFEYLTKVKISGREYWGIKCPLFEVNLREQRVVEAVEQIK